MFEGGNLAEGNLNEAKAAQVSPSVGPPAHA
jgi:hypothetical protein